MVISKLGSTSFAHKITACPTAKAIIANRIYSHIKSIRKTIGTNLLIMPLFVAQQTRKIRVCFKLTKQSLALMRIKKQCT